MTTQPFEFPTVSSNQKDKSILGFIEEIFSSERKKYLEEKAKITNIAIYDIGQIFVKLISQLYRLDVRYQNTKRGVAVFCLDKIHNISIEYLIVLRGGVFWLTISDFTNTPNHNARSCDQTNFITIYWQNMSFVLVQISLIFRSFVQKYIQF